MSPDVVARSLLVNTQTLVQDAPSLAGSPTAPAVGASGTATTGASGATGTGLAPAAGTNSGMLLFLPLIVLWIVIMIWSSRRESKRKRSLLEGVKKHDRVQTAGGVIGSVVELKPDLVVLKVDENSNTRVTFARSAIVAILKEGPADSAKESAAPSK